MKLKQLIATGTTILYLGCTPIVPTIPDNTQETIISIEEQESKRDDFNINLVLQEYVVGSPFYFSGQIQNKTLSNIIVDNTSRNSLEYKLLKYTPQPLMASCNGRIVKLRGGSSKEISAITNGEMLSSPASSEQLLAEDYTLILTEKLPAFILTLYPSGFIEMAYSENKFKTGLLGARFEGERTIEVPIILGKPLSFSFPYESFTFTESGLYLLQASVKYSIDGKDYDCSFEKEVSVE